MLRLKLRELLWSRGFGIKRKLTKQEFSENRKNYVSSKRDCSNLLSSRP